MGDIVAWKFQCIMCATVKFWYEFFTLPTLPNLKLPTHLPYLPYLTLPYLELSYVLMSTSKYPLTNGLTLTSPLKTVPMKSKYAKILCNNYMVSLIKSQLK